MHKLAPLALFALSLIGGVIAALALPPAHYIWAFFVGMSLFFLCFEHAHTKRAAFFVGWCFGFGYFLLSLHWIGNALLVEGNDYEWAWPLAIAGLPAGLALFTGVATWLAHNFKSAHIAMRYISFVIALAAAEWLRGHILTGFPWNLSGSIWANTLEMLQILWPTSIYGLSLLTLFWSALPALMWQARLSPRAVKPVLIIGLISAIGTYSYGMYRLQNTTLEPLANTYTHIIQPNIEQSEKWQADLMEGHFEDHLRLSSPENGAASGTHIVVWPETAITQGYLDSPLAQQKISAMLQHYDGDAYLLSGALRFDYNGENQTRRYYNSLITMDESGAVQATYDKHHLVPFGEYIPFQSLIPLKTVSQFSGFAQGAGVQTQKITPHFSFSPLICYEVIFSGNAVKSASAPDAIVNVTNDAWYGVSAGPHQHLTQAQFRAIEEGVSVLRAANTGFSAIISPLGVIQAQTTLFENAKITHSIYKRIPPLFVSKRAVNYTIFTIYILFFSFFLIIKRLKNMTKSLKNT